MPFLARRLGPELPIEPMAPHGIGNGSIPKTIEAMARDRLRDIKAVQARGPYRLGGHCVGSVVAYEAARLLIAEGHEVELVVMIEPIWVVGNEALKMHPYSDDVSDNSVDRSAPPSGNAGAGSPDAPPAIPDLTATPQSLRAYRNALVRYSAKPITAPLLIFASKYDGRPWRSMSTDVELIARAGGHYDWVTTRADSFVDQLKGRLHVERSRPPTLALHKGL